MYAEHLVEAMRERAKGVAFAVWTSTLRRTTETADRLLLPTRPWRALDEIDSGICDGMTYSEIAEAMPGEFAGRVANKFRYRYPRGESYQDVIQRLEPVIFRNSNASAPPFSSSGTRRFCERSTRI